MSEGTKLGEANENLIFNEKNENNEKKKNNHMSATKIGDKSGLNKDLIQEIQDDEVSEVQASKKKLETNFEIFENEFKKEMEKPLAEYNNGDLIQGTIRCIEKSGILVDINYKSDGYIPNSEISFNSNFNVSKELAEGDQIKVIIDKLETKEGYTMLSRKRVEIIETWEEIVECYKTKNTLTVDIASRVQGGLVISYRGVKGFIPASQVILNEDEELDDFVNQQLKVIPIQADWRRRKFICSHKLLLHNERKETNIKLYDELETGSICKGKITSIKDFGVFVDIGGAEGLVHISEMSWSRVITPSDFVNVGDDVNVFVIGVDKDNHRISLGMKQLQPDPWVEVNKQYKVGQIIKGTIVRLVPFGAFIRIGETIEGLIHISELSNEHVKKVSDIVTVGQTVDAKIIKLIPEDQKIGLTLKNINTTEGTSSEKEVEITESENTSEVVESENKAEVVESENKIEEASS